MTFLEDIRAILRTGPMQSRYGGELSGLRLYAYVPVMLAFNPGVLAIGLHRLAHAIVLLPFPARYLALLIDRINTLVTGAQIPAGATIGPGMVIMHPQAVVLAPNLVAGRNLCIIGPSVTIGWQDVDGEPGDQVVAVGDDVVVSAGAKVLGPLTVGDRVKIGPNATLMEDAGDDSTVVSAARTKVLALGLDD